MRPVCKRALAAAFAILFICLSAGCAARAGDGAGSASAPGSVSAVQTGSTGESTLPRGIPRYGVFIGADPAQIDSFAAYDLVVVDAAYYEKADIDTLHEMGIRVYSYLNIGSLEDFRDFFSEYEHLILGAYEDWPGEYWVNVASPEWQSLIRTRAALLTEKGIDGFFIDNTDVYYQYHTSEIFRGISDILNDLALHRKDIIINGGDVFVTEAILETDTPSIQITGVNQECVFTGIDFNSGQFTRQNPEDSEYYQNYIEQCSWYGLAVYLLEYTTDPALIRQIEEYCSAHQFGYYVSSSLDLQ